MVDLDRIKAALSCRDVAERLGVHIPPRADAKCPKHQGHSLRVKEDYFKCWGGCADHGGQGDVIALYMWLQEVDFKTAVEELSRWAGVPIEWSPADKEHIERKRKVEDILTFAADFYTRHYINSPAQVYAQSRHLECDDARLGYAPDTWDTLTTALHEHGVVMDLAVEAGLVKERDRGGYYDRLRHRLIIPAFERGRCVYLQGRALEGGETDKGEPKYLNAALADPPIYSVNGAITNKTPIITESTSDTLRLTAAQLPALGTYGSNLSPTQRIRLARYERLYIAVHNDPAGVAFADTLAGVAGEKVRIVPPPSEYKDWDQALEAGVQWAADDTMTWLRWKVRQLPPDTDSVLLRQQLQPIIAYLAQINDEAVIAAYLDELRQRFRWRREIAQAYAKQVRDLRIQRQNEQRDEEADVGDESAELGATLEPPIFISPALAMHNGVVYVSQMMAFQSSVTTKKHGTVTAPVWRPVILTSERRRLVPTPPPQGAPEGALTYLDPAARLALRGGFYEAAEERWHYNGIVAFLNGTSPTVAAHEIYDALLASLRRYVHHGEDSSYVVDVLWTMGTYFHQLWNAYPYLALHGRRSAGKSTLLTWLSATAFNARFLVNTSEASLYRSIQAQAPTLLIDEQEGLNSSKAAKETKADLMGLLKSGYKRGGAVARQRIDRPEITEYFDVYSPKALAAIEHFEDVLESRAILTFMTEKPASVHLEESDAILNREVQEFAPLRDQLYLLLMQEAANVLRITERVQFSATNRFRELFKPLFAMATLVDLSRGMGRQTLDALEYAAAAKATLRKERDDLTPEAQLREALLHVIADAHGDPTDLSRATLLEDGRVRMDSRQISDAFEAMFTKAGHSYFNDTWLGKQMQAVAGVTKDTPPRRARKIEEFDREKNEMIWKLRYMSVYLVEPAKL